MESQELNNMTKPRWYRRLKILNEGKEHFLGYLGALGPQILFGTIAAVVYHGIDFSRDTDGDNYLKAFVFFCLLLIIVLAMIANTMRLYEKCFRDEWDIWRVQLGLALDEKGVQGRFSRNIARLKAAFTERRVEIFEFLLALFLVNLTVAVVPAMATRTASDMLKLNPQEHIACTQSSAKK